MSPASSPESPTAYEPCWLTDATISRLTLPTSAMRTMSTVSASVTRRPSTNSGSLPSRRISSVICGPPPCTTTGFMPTSRMSTTSWANRSASAGSSIAWPPYLMTTVLPENSRMYGSASARTCALSPDVGASAIVVAHDVPMFSSMYACVRSVVSIVASPCAERAGRRRSSMSRCGHRARRARPRRARTRCRRGTRRRRCRRCRRCSGSKRAPLAPSSREHPAPVRVLAVRASTARAGCRATARAAVARLGVGCARRRTRDARRTWSRPRRRAAICSASEPHTSVSASANARSAARRVDRRRRRAVGEHEHGVVGARAAVDDERVERVARPRRAARAAAAPASTAASVVSTASIVAIAGDEHRRALGHAADGRGRRRHRRDAPPCGTVSVVMIASRGGARRRRRRAAPHELRDARPRAASIGIGMPMRPVEQTSTSVGRAAERLRR